MPSLKRVVSIAMWPETLEKQGRIWVARHSLPISALAQGYSVRSTLAPANVVSPKRIPPPAGSPAEKSAPWLPRRQPPNPISPSTAANGIAGSSTVIVSARRADQEAGSAAHHLLSARAQSSRSSTAATGIGKPATNSRGVRSVVAAARKGSKPPPQLIAPIRCSRPSWSACHQLPRTWVIRCRAAPSSASGRSGCRRWCPGPRG